MSELPDGRTVRDSTTGRPRPLLGDVELRLEVGYEEVGEYVWLVDLDPVTGLIDAFVAPFAVGVFPCSLHEVLDQRIRLGQPADHVVDVGMAAPQPKVCPVVRRQPFSCNVDGLEELHVPGSLELLDPQFVEECRVAGAHQHESINSGWVEHRQIRSGCGTPVVTDDVGRRHVEVIEHGNLWGPNIASCLVRLRFGIR